MWLTATTTAGMCLSAECSMRHNVQTTVRYDSFQIKTTQHTVQRKQMELPEDLGRRAATRLLHEVHAGGCVDAHCQSFALLLMCLTPEDVSRLRTGPLSQFAVVSLRLFKEALGVEFKLRVATQESGDGGEDGVEVFDQSSVICSCLGIGYRNMARAST